MKLTRRPTGAAGRALVSFAVVAMVTIGGGGTRAQTSAGVTFVQWTDLHLFDAGAGRQAEGVGEEALDNRAALHWAVIETNRLRRVENRTIDFVVITGDFGLNNVKMDHEGSGMPPCECPLTQRTGDGPIEPVGVSEAAAELGRALSALQVPRVLLVPGESDLCREDAGDLHRWADFVRRVQNDVMERANRRALRVSGAPVSPGTTLGPAEIVDLTHTAEFIAQRGDPRVKADAFRNTPVRVAPVVVNGITLVGLNSAFFRPHPDARLRKRADAAIASEIALAASRVRPGTTNIVFTHIPDLVEPVLDAAVAPSTGNGPDPGSAWRLSGAGASVRKQWTQEILGRSNVAGVFAGHFHRAVRDDYPQGFSWITDQAVRGARRVRQTWVAPPLAEAMQWTPTGQKTARGMLLVTVAHDASLRLSNERDPVVDVKPIWFSTQDQKAAIAGDDKLAQARAFELDGAFAAAATSFTEALGSADPAARATAEAGLSRTRALMRSWWWQAGTVVPPIRWAALAGRGDRFTFLDATERWWAAVVVGAIALIPALLIRRMSRRAVLLKADQLTTDAPGSWLSEEIMQAQEEIAWRLRRETNLHQAGGRFVGTFVLTAPASALSDITVPSIQGTDVSAIVKFLQQIWRYFSWQVQPSIALKDTNLSVFASRRWAWRSGGAWREIRTLTLTPGAAAAPATNLAQELPIAARRIAARIVGVSYTRRRAWGLE